MGTISIMYMIYIDMVFQEVHTEVHVMTLTSELLISLGVWEDGIKISIAGDLWSDNGMAINGICGHGITHNWEMKTVLLTASPCGHERHTGEYTLRLKQQHF